MPGPTARRALGRRSWKAALVGGVLVAGMAPVSADITVGPASVIGRWGIPFEEGGMSTPTCARQDGRVACKPVAQAMGVVPDGRVLYFDDSGARILDLRSGGPTWGPAPDGSRQPDHDLFGADVASLSDGRLLLTGGAHRYDDPGVDTPTDTDVGLSEADGLPDSRLYDPVTNRVQPAGPLHFARWYPTTVTLPDGRVLVAGGAARQAKNTSAGNVRPTEIFDPGTGAWTLNTAPESEASLPLSPHLHLMPNGKVLYAATGESFAPYGATADEALYPLLQFFDPDRARWDVIGPDTFGMRDGAATVMLAMDPPYDHATVLTFGGAIGPPPGSAAGTSLVTSTAVNRDGRVKERKTRWEMREGRWNPSGVVLPDGSVLAMGGASSSDTTAPGTGLATRTAELFDPTTEQWSAMAPTNRDRTYGHSAVLLPDGRVLFGGHAPPANPAAPGSGFGGPFPNNARDASFEVFTPHYLFRGPRPTIRHLQAGVAWGATFDLATHQALSIQSVVLSRLPSPGHSVDSDARTIRLAFQRRSNALRVTAPPDGRVAPPGYYYLFVNGETRQGLVPSMARIIHVGPTADASEAVQPFPDDSRSR